MKLRRVIYTSEATQDFTERDLLDMLHLSRDYNKVDKVSGFLMHKNGRFLQVIEGASEVIDDLQNRLSQDQRHHSIKTLSDCMVDSRVFPSWSMGWTDFDDPSLGFLPGLRTDLNDPDVIEEIINHLLEVAEFFLESKKLSILPESTI